MNKKNKFNSQPERTEGEARRSDDLGFGHLEFISDDLSVLTCSALDLDGGESYLKRHIHEIIGKESDVDELTKEMERDNVLLPWDNLQFDPSLDEDVIPKKIHNMIDRHIELFNRYKDRKSVV